MDDLWVTTEEKKEKRCRQALSTFQQQLRRFGESERALSSRVECESFLGSEVLALMCL